MPSTIESMVANWIRAKVQSVTPAPPASGFGIFYDKNGTPAYQNAAGVEMILGTSIKNDYILVRDEKTQNTAGGTFTNGAQRTRDINTEVSDVAGLCSLPGANVIRLAAGTYTCSIICPAFYCDSHQAQLYNNTAAALLLLGSNAQTPSGAVNEAQTNSHINGKFTLAVQSDLIITHRCGTTRATDGFGRPAYFTTEVYTIAEFWRVA